MEKYEVPAAIQSGDFDIYLNELNTAIKRRREMLSRMALVQLKAGDQFRIQNVSPKYLNGALVEFIEYRGGAAPVHVKFVYGVRQYRSGQSINLRETHIGEVR